MPEPDNSQPPKVPPRALAISLGALLVPVLADLLLPRAVLGSYQALLWLTALVPAFLLAYYRGWQGAATALAAGMVTLSLTQAVANWLGRPVPDLLGGVVAAYLAIILGVGWLAERLHRDRAEIEDLAFTDLLTHLPNRRHARVFLENEFAAAERGRPLSVVLFDLDDFKRYNDRYGHVVGDQALAAFAEILSQTTRKMNLSARFGGEEFLSVLAGSDVEGALVFAERVRSAIRTKKFPNGTLTVSAGVAAHHPSMRSPDELLAAADHALYQAKHDGKDCVRLFGRTLSEEAVTETPATEAEEWEEEGEARDRESDKEGRGRKEPAEYPRAPDEMGKTAPPVTLLPQKVTGFGGGRKVLLVEEEEGVRDALVSYLEKEAFGLTLAQDPAEAVQVLGTEFDIVITDLSPPGRGGMELVKAAKARWPTSQVLAITGVQDVRLAAEAISAGADRCLQKPFGMPELRRELVEALARRDRLVMERSRSRLLSAEAQDRQDRAQTEILRAADALVQAVEVRDPYLLGHHETVTLYAEEIRKGVDPDGRELVPASLHLGTRFLDVGKINLPTDLLAKEEGLTAEEVELLETHPGTGRQILEPLLDDVTALEVVTWHHERWDGGGYPNGLLGESIPLAARIAAVADSLAAMTSARSYRDALPWEEAADRIVGLRETQFDPRVVDAFQESLSRLRSVHRSRNAPPSPHLPRG
jgi:diguanylate cyclase (GGDEF)-like protein